MTFNEGIDYAAKLVEMVGDNQDPIVCSYATSNTFYKLADMIKGMKNERSYERRKVRDKLAAKGS